MPLRPDRRQMLALTAAAIAAPLIPTAALAEPAMGDIILGDPNAPATVIEYASLTCPHCARFAMTTFPEFKTNYIDTGKVNFILREVYFDRYGLWAAMAARCGGQDAFYPMAEMFLTTQQTWARADTDQIAGEIKKIARLNGLTDEQFDACLSDQDYAKSLIETYQNHAKADEVTSTPTFIINGEKKSGEMDYKTFSEWVDTHLPKS